VIKAVGTTGDARHKLGFAIGPLCFDMPDEDVRRFIRDAFAVARENDVAVALHIDDSMSWGTRKDLLSNPDNIETADWRQIPSTGRRLDWGPSVVRQKFVSVSAGVRFRRRLVVERCNSPFSRAPIGRAGVSWCNTSMAW